MYDEHWYVQESIVQVDRSNLDAIELYRERGFYIIQDPDGEYDPSKIVMGRHRLVLEGEEDIKAEEPVSLAHLIDATGDASVVPSATSIPHYLQSTTGSATVGALSKKQKTK